MKIIGVVIGIVLLLAAIFFVYGSRITENQEKRLLATPTQSVQQSVEKAATFAIFTNQTVRIFTDPKYHNQSEDVFIQAENPQTVHVKKQGTTWGDFFNTLPMKLEKECLTTGTGQVFCTGSSGALSFYINGKKDADALDREINDGDKLLVSFGSETDIQNQLRQILNNE